MVYCIKIHRKGSVIMRILVIDGNSILNRAFYGVKVLTNSKGFPTNAITGFMNVFLRERDRLKPDCAAVAFDLKAPTFRHKACDFYKANRKGMPDELAQQLPKVKELLSDLGVKVLETEGFEADDILGSVAELFSAPEDEVFILSGDRDILQLIGGNATVLLATARETVSYDRDLFYSEYGVEPIRLIDIKALMGDSSDNIPGVQGIGEKTAKALIAEYGSVEELYDRLETADLTPSAKSKLENGRESAFQSKWLATIVRNAPIPQDKSAYLPAEPDSEAAASLLTELEMFKLLDRLGLERVSAVPAASASEPEREITVKPLSAEGIAELSGKPTCFIYKDGELEVISDFTVYTSDDPDLILGYFTSDGEKTAFSAKAAYKLCFENGRELKGLAFICDLAGYLLNSQATDYTVSNLCGSNNVPYSSNPDRADIISLPALSEKLRSEVERTGMSSLLYDIEQPLCEVLASMEVLGVRVDSDGIRAFGKSLEADISELEQRIYLLAGKQFNINSSKQLGEVLFEDLGLPRGKKNHRGFSTSAEVLEDLVPIHPIAQDILDYRTLTKLRSTYVDGLLEEVCPDGRVRSEFKQTETRTGRISSSNPNMQNIPVRKELGRNMRKFFIAAEGKTLLDADYSQIELRVLASMSGDENMRDAFLSGADIHTRTASQVFGLPEDFVDPNMRRAAKAVNFGIIYGIGAFSLSKDINCSVAEADRYIKNYLGTYPKIDKFMNDTVEFAQKNGYVTTLFGRRRYIPELKASNNNLRSFGKRAAMNAPIQGTAADIIKIAMIRVYRRLKEEKLDAKLILQVHDELIVETSESCREEAAKVLSEEMQKAVELSVPLTADVNAGRSWYDAKK